LVKAYGISGSDLQNLVMIGGFVGYNAADKVEHYKATKTNAFWLDLASNGKTKGVIKVDAEGYEKFIVNTIISVKPKEIEVVVVFENWKNYVAINEYLGKDEKAFDLYKLESNRFKFKSAPRWLNSLINFLRGGFPIVLKHCVHKISAGTYLLISKS
jgi:hypothetical protein